MSEDNKVNFCKKCDQILHSDSKYCKWCREKVSESTVEPDASTSEQSGANPTTEPESESDIPPLTEAYRSSGTEVESTNQEDRPHSEITNKTENKPGNHTDNPRSQNQADGISKIKISAYTQGQKVTLVGAGLTIIGALLPWITVNVFGGVVSKLGIEADGMFTLLLGLAVIGVIYYSGPSGWGKTSRATVGLVGLIIGLVGVIYIADPWVGISEQPPEATREMVNIGIGLYLTAIGGLLIFLGAMSESR